MNTFFCRAFQCCFAVGARFLPWRTPEVFSGEGSLLRAADILRENGLRRPFVIASRRQCADEHFRALQEKLDEQDILLSIFSSVEPNPSVETVEKIAAGFDGIVLVDEAYAPFADYSCVPLVEKYPNLIVTGTSSKGLGLAGMRIGWAFANPAIIEVLDRVRDSYNLDRLAQAAGIAALADAPYYAQKCGAVIAERESVEKFFDKLGWQYHKSSANFVFFRPNKNGKKGAKVAADLFEFMRGKKILMRYFPTQKKIADGIRLSIGTAAQMKLFKKAALEWAQK